uniref:Amidase domain-containing protein n=1 Tax=Heterorhabditis bacteriophora TaxID=37862 RepID=A0A1I7XS85_HETBA
MILKENLETKKPDPEVLQYFHDYYLSTPNRSRHSSFNDESRFYTFNSSLALPQIYTVSLSNIQWPNDNEIRRKYGVVQTKSGNCEDVVDDLSVVELEYTEGIIARRNISGTCKWFSTGLAEYGGGKVGGTSSASITSGIFDRVPLTLAEYGGGADDTVISGSAASCIFGKLGCSNDENSSTEGLFRILLFTNGI